MTENNYKGHDRRQFVRLDYTTPIAYKVCSKETISRLLEGYTSDISVSGLFCSIKEKVHKEDILWLAFDRGALSICAEMEKRCLIYQNGIIGKVVRVEYNEKDNVYRIGIQFVTREEKNLTNIYPKIHFLKLDGKESFNAGQDNEESIDEPRLEPEYGISEEEEEER